MCGDRNWLDVGCVQSQEAQWQTSLCRKDTNFNTRRPNNTFWGDIFECIGMNENCSVLIYVSLTIVLSGPVGNNSAMVHVMAERLRRQALNWTNNDLAQ